jgi:hypothetical protein
MKSVRMCFLALCVSMQAFALENSLLNLKLPTALEARQAQFIVQHRFFGLVDVKPIDTFFGMSEGANVGIGFRVRVAQKAEVFASHVIRAKEYSAGAGHAFDFPGLPLRGQVDLQYVTYSHFVVSQAGASEKREHLFFGQLDLAAALHGGRLTPVANLGYDSETDRWGLGIGLNAGVFERLSLIAEYFPRLTDRNDGLADAVALGVKVQTYGHHFLFQLSNGTVIGTRRLMAGVPRSIQTDTGTRNHPWMFGFGIQRLLEF